MSLTGEERVVIYGGGGRGEGGGEEVGGWKDFGCVTITFTSSP